ncbi:MAG: hypothetical protein AAF682_04220 [Planctomycetota bacterium]
MRAFIIRPFGTKEIRLDSGDELAIDFNAVESALIDPALDAQPDGITGRTTGEIVRSGNIRSDMFEQILVADLVVADISIHNANVFYELGIRHALRDRMTVLIKSRVPGHEAPFDLKTDRYLEYDRTDPGASLAALTDVIRQTIAAKSGDSPVLALVPALQPVDPQRVLVVPREFSEEVERAAQRKARGHLRLLAEEAMGLQWEVAAQREVGSAQFHLRDMEGAKASLTRVLDQFPDDVRANTLMGTVWQRLGDLVRSSQALERVLASDEPTMNERAEARALRARNEKTLWEQDWSGEVVVAERQCAALRSAHLEPSGSEYAAAFREDRNHFYSGVNALAMIEVRLALAEAHPDVWAERFVRDRDADHELEDLREAAQDLASAVRLSVSSGVERLEREGSDELVWARVSQADLAFLTVQKPAAVLHEYKCALAGTADFVGSAARKQIELYDRLGLFRENAQAILEEIPPDNGKPSAEHRTVVFTGHRIDAPNRERARFPADSVEEAKAMIREALDAEKSDAGDVPLVGISGGASGGDILFHEVCAEFGIPTRMYLAIPKQNYIVESVQDAGADWVSRFNVLATQLDPEILSDAARLPDWLRSKSDYDVWQRSNLWMLHTAFAESGGASVLALWDGAEGDGPGGTQDMARRAKSRGARFVHLDARRLRPPQG